MRLYKCLVFPLSISWILSSQITHSQTVDSAMHREAAQLVMGMSRAQQAYYVENNRFANEIKQLGIKIPSSLEKSYQVRMFVNSNGSAVMLASLPVNQANRSYIGLVRTYRLRNQNQPTTLATLCESLELKAILPIWSDYRIPTNDSPACPAGFRVFTGKQGFIPEKEPLPPQGYDRILAIGQQQVQFYTRNNRFKKDWGNISGEDSKYLYRHFTHPSGKAAMVAAISRNTSDKSYISLVHTLKPSAGKPRLHAIQCVSKEAKGILPRWSDINFSEDKQASCPSGFETLRTGNRE